MHNKWIAVAALWLAAGAAHAEWHYEQDIHPATGQVSRYAEIESVNLVARRPPHPAGRGSLLIWDSPRAGTLIGVSVELGKMACDGKVGCQVLVQFDSGTPVSFKGLSPVDEPADSVLLEPAATFIERAREARRLRVALPTDGAEQWLEFRAGSPLQWLGLK